MKNIIGKYIDEGYVWFVFDVIYITTITKSKQALKFEFLTDRLYYPLKISSTESGETKIDLLILTKELLYNNMMLGIPFENIKFPRRPVSLSSKELQDLDEEISKLLGMPHECWFRIWSI